MALAIKSNPGDFAETVIMPGDPLRAKYIAEKYLDNAVEVNNVRNMLGYTGTYKGKSLSVMAHGMGIPSISMYAYELIHEFGVKNLIRIGSCGSVRDDIELMDVVIAMGASTDSKTNRDRFKGHDLAAIADYELLETAVNTARTKELNVKVGNLFTCDLFYGPDPDVFQTLEKYGIVGVDMEVAGLYAVAAELGAKALGILTTTDHIKNGGLLSIEEREVSLHQMIELALDTATQL
ncbi:purine-nucleoside phosphorylase [Vibrio mediterranei]|uniref:purine-nucleoside phosphorylase n=1 Tax=Vibrio TaxID=662 RepID=UPI0004DD523B|nr:MULTISPECIES: purine-nucleoside phosphorylase [Vibrio]KFA99322.1 purine nucleoside phosphorylase [Vibrio sp. ER1A]MCG9628202.1 purine-nucleoside phosphorylase [Vibrio mediterranei]